MMHINITLPLQQLRRRRIYSKEYIQRIVLLLLSTPSLTLLLYFPTAPCKSSHGISVTGQCAQYLIVVVSHKINKQTDQFKLPVSQKIVTGHSFNSRYSNIYVTNEPHIAQAFPRLRSHKALHTILNNILT